MMRDRLEPVEVFLLLAGAWLHDVGMNPHLFAELSRSDPSLPQDLPRFVSRTEEATLAADKIVRDLHAERSGIYVRKMWRELGFTEDEAKAVAKMCELHRHEKYLELYREPWESGPLKVKVPLLVGYLRLADTLHIPGRENSPQFMDYLSMGLDPVARFHWFKSRYSSKTEVMPERYLVRTTLRAPVPGPSGKDWATELEPLQRVLATDIQNELDTVKDILAQGGLTVYLKAECVIGQDDQMDADDVEQLGQLLNHVELFDPTFTPCASMVFDSVIRQVEVFLGARTPELQATYLRYYAANVLAVLQPQRPSHVFLARMRELLDDMLPRRAMADHTADREAIALIRSAVAAWKKQKSEADAAIPELAYGILADADPVLVYGFSTTVISCLKHALERMRPTRVGRRELVVYVCDCRPKTEYRFNNRLRHSDCMTYIEELVKADKQIEPPVRSRGTSPSRVRLKVAYIPDAGVSHLLAHGRGQVSRVLFGANGIDQTDFRVAHSLGHLAVADMARAYGIPVYVFADSLKFGKLPKSPSPATQGAAVGRDIQRGNKWLTKDVEFEQKLVGLESYNPRCDIVPPDRIEAIVSEKGVIEHPASAPPLRDV
jgi:translation initiation factor 2B subunit (eIF-2B alpha/beta/delta family)